MGRFLIIGYSSAVAFTEGGEKQEKIPRAPNGFLYCVRGIYDNTFFINAGYACHTFYNDKSADVPTTAMNRKVIGTVRSSLDTTNKNNFSNSQLYPRGAFIINEPYITVVSHLSGTLYGILHVLLELIPCSQIEQLKSDLLASD